jgi:glutathione synthase/RimK-type ligase-like ATP-grasp enzyme
MTGAFITPSPRYHTSGFIDSIERILDARAIDLVVPTFEEAFYLARHRQRLETHCHLFMPELETLELLHDKSRFMSWAAELGLDVPCTRTVTDFAELHAALREFSEYFARPVFSRGGLRLLTNAGPLAGVLELDECCPTAVCPWIVQEYVHGVDVCSFSVVQHGRVVAHSAYVHPAVEGDGGAITFESISDPETLEVAQIVAAASNYHGQLSLDFIRSSDGLFVIECNPRACAGVMVMPDSMFVEALFAHRPAAPAIAPARLRRTIDLSVLRDVLGQGVHGPKDVVALVARALEVYADPEEMFTALFALLSYGHVCTLRGAVALRPQNREDLARAYFYDVCWDGAVFEQVGATSSTGQGVSRSP